MSNNTPTGNNSILNVFKDEFASTVNVVFINSLNKKLKFKEVTVTEQKTLSKIMIENETKKDIVYDAQCALIDKLCLDKNIDVETIDPETNEVSVTQKKFSIYDLTEFDRIRILMEIYQNNYFKNEIKYTCEECGFENIYNIDFTQISSKLDEFDLKDIQYYIEDRNHSYCFTLNYPIVQNVSNFYKSYSKKTKGLSQKQREMSESFEQMEYFNLFIKSIEVTNKVTNKKTIADLTTMSFKDIEELISFFPQNIVFGEENGLIKFIATEFLEKINNIFTYEKCINCGAATTEGIGSISDFF